MRSARADTPRRRTPRAGRDALGDTRPRDRAADFVWTVPGNLSHNEAAAIPITYLTAVVALYRMAT